MSIKTRKGWGPLHYIGGSTFVFLLLVISVSLAMGYFPESQPQFGGPYTARTFGGQNNVGISARWNEGAIAIHADAPRTFGFTISIEVDVGSYEINGDCRIHLDREKSGRGDRLPLHEGTTFTTDKMIWALVEADHDSEGCTIRRAA